MKKLLIFFTILISLSASAQTEEGVWLLEVGTTPFGDNSFKQGNSTGFNLLSTDGTTLFAIGAEGGYFVSDNTALKFGLGYTDLDETGSFFTYKIGFKHYARGNIPFQIDITGATNEDQDFGFGDPVDIPDPLWLGFQFGYAAFLSEDIAFEPALRYNVTLNDDFTEDNLLELRFNFVIFF